MPDLIVDHATAELLCGGPDDLRVVTSPGVEPAQGDRVSLVGPVTDILRIGVDGLTIKSRVGDLIVPVLGSLALTSLYGGVALLDSAAPPVSVLTNTRPVQLLSRLVVAKGAVEKQKYWNVSLVRFVSYKVLWQ